MPLSKARDRERKRLTRLENKNVQPKRLNPVQPKLAELRGLIGRMESKPMPSMVVTPLVRGAEFNIDADGNLIPEYI